MGEWRGGSWVWVFNWRRTLLQREEEWVRDLNSFLSNSKPNREMVDGWKWVLSKTGVYTAKAAYEFLQGPPTPVVDKQLEFEVMTEDEVDSGHGFRTPEAFCTVLEETFVRSVFCGFAVGVRAVFVLWVDDQVCLFVDFAIVRIVFGGAGGGPVVSSTTVKRFVAERCGSILGGWFGIMYPAPGGVVSLLFAGPLVDLVFCFGRWLFWFFVELCGFVLFLLFVFAGML
ncbi:hypothetical protein Ancab_016016 [Ancistrocladus abbreviatus]